MDTVESLREDRDSARAELLTERVARCFNGSQFIRERFTVPADMMLAAFGKHFSIEDGRAVAKDASGQRIMSRERPGDAADFEEALGILVSQSDYADQITCRPRGDGKPNAALPPMSRGAYDKMSPWQQGEWARGGGRVS